MYFLAQTDIADTINAILSKPIDVLLAGVLFGLMVVGLIVARAFSRWVTNVDRMFARRDEIDRELMTFIKQSSTAVSESVSASNRAAVASENAAERVADMDVSLHEWHKQNRKVVPALIAIYRRVGVVERKLDNLDNTQIHQELLAMRTELREAARLAVTEDGLSINQKPQE